MLVDVLYEIYFTICFSFFCFGGISYSMIYVDVLVDSRISLTILGCFDFVEISFLSHY